MRATQSFGAGGEIKELGDRFPLSGVRGGGRPSLGEGMGLCPGFNVIPYIN